MDFLGPNTILYINAGIVVIVFSVVGLMGDGLNRVVKWILIAVGIIIGFGLIAAIITGGLGLIALPFMDN